MEKNKNLSDENVFPAIEIICSPDEREHSLGRLVVNGEIDSQQASDWGRALEWIERATLFPSEQRE